MAHKKSGDNIGNFQVHHSRLTIGFLTGEILGPNHQLVWSGVVDAAREQDVNLLSFPGGVLRGPRGFEAQGNVIFDLIDDGHIHGLIIWSGFLNWCISQDEMEMFCRRYASLPIVSGEQAFQGIPGILTDDYQSMRQAIVHLIEVHGYRRIAFIRGPEHNSLAQERYRAYTETLAEYGIPLDPHLVPPATLVWEQAEAADRIAQLLDQRASQDVEAVVLANDNMALGALTALQSRGVRVPNDLALVGYDDMIQTRATPPPLTTVSPLHYERGRKAVERLLAMMDGAEVPEKEVLTGRLVVRESCGCLSPTIVQAAARIEGVPEKGTTRDGRASFETVLAERRPEILVEMTHAIGTGKADSQWAEQILNAFIAELKGATDNPFLAVLKEVLHQGELAGRDIEAWQNALSVLRRQVLSALGAQEVSRAEDLWQQARVMIGETAKRVEMYRAWQREEQVRMLEEIESALITTFDMAGLMDVLYRELPRLGIPSCYLSVYEKPEASAQLARLMLGYTEQGRVDLEPRGRCFPALQLAPDEMWPRARRSSFVVAPLYFQHTQLGFVLFEMGPHEGRVYEALKGEISSALQGALLVQQVQEHAHELAAAYQEIQILNSQLQEENLRMSAELDVSRRIQQMILPAPEELQQMEGLDIVGFMKPADEVGGDYYDVLEERGMLHIGIGDVTGHGLESGVLMLMTQTAIRTLIEHGETDPVVFLETLNRTVYKNIQRMKVDKTLTLAFVKYQNGCLKLIGQHEELLVVRRGGQVERVDTIDLGFPLGLEEHITRFIAEKTISLQPGDGIVLYTDGITEAENTEGTLYGIERLCEIVSQFWDRSAEAIKQAIIDDVTRHIGQQKVYDDLTLVVLKQK